MLDFKKILLCNLSSITLVKYFANDVIELKRRARMTPSIVIQ